MLEDFVVLDVEATGVDPKKDEIIEVAIIRVKDFSIVDQFETLIRPQERLDKAIEGLTGITNEALKTAPQWDEVRDRVAAFIGELPVAGHNVNFDFEYLSSHGIKLANPRLDSWELATTFLPKWPAYSLSYLSYRLNLPSQPTHRAMADVLATLELFKTILVRVSRLPATVRKELALHLRKSNWVWRELFEKGTKIPKFDLPAEIEVERTALEPALTEIKAPAPKGRLSFYDLAAGQNELSAALALAKQWAAERKVLFLWPSVAPEPASILHDEFILYPASHYLSIEEFELFLEKKSLSDLETRILVKTLIWRQAGAVPGELYLTKDEFYFWERWLGEGDVQAPSFQQALQQFKKSNFAVVMPLALRDLLQAELDLKDVLLVIADPLNFEEEGYRQDRFLVSANMFEGFVSRRRELLERLAIEASLKDELFKLLRNISSSLTFLLAQLGVTYEAFSPEGRMLEILEYLWSSAQGSRTKLLAEKLAADIALFHQKLAKLKVVGVLAKRVDDVIERGKALEKMLISLARVKDFTFWLKSREATVFLEALPENWQSFLLTASKQAFGAVASLSATVISGNGHRYLTRFFGEKGEFFEVQGSTLKPFLKVAKNAPLPKEADYEVRLERELSRLLEERMSTIVLFPSRQRASDFFEAFVGKAPPDLGIALPETLGLLPKVNEFLRSKNNVLVVTLDWWLRLPALTNDLEAQSRLPFERLVIISLPFEVPDAPQLLALGKKLNHKQDSFRELTLPRTTFRLRRIVNPALESLNLREIVLLDGRLERTEYGSEILNELGSLLTPT